MNKWSWLVLALFAFSSGHAVAEEAGCEVTDYYPVTASDLRGASLFERYCTLCHGKRANGKGRAARLHDPAPANLRTTKNPEEYKREIILKGGEAIGRGIGMPPWKDEFSKRQLGDLLSYLDRIVVVESKRTKACAELDKKDRRKDEFHPYELITDSKVFRGSIVFENHCAFCHGSDADGKSKTAALFKPRPANLMKSTLTDEEMTKIVNDGGQSVGRSSVMPAWKDNLTEEQISDVVKFLRRIRIQDAK